MKNKSGLVEEIEFSNGISVKKEEKLIILSKGIEKIEKSISPLISADIENNKIIFKTKKSGKTERRILGALIAHIKNALTGLNEPFKYKLQVASVHFPMTITHDKNSNEIIIKNFLGEKKDRKVNVMNGVNVKISKDFIELESADIEKAGQTAANIEKGTKIRFRDRRVFQDGIFIIEKPGRVFL